MKIIIDDLNGQAVINLLNEHLTDMYSVSPAESVHALNLDELKDSKITFWSIWDGEKLAGCGALKELNEREAEIKSMRTAKDFRRRGVAATMLSHILDTAKQREYHTLYLETGPQDFFRPAVELYKRFGFEERGPFADYRVDPYSLFMQKTLI